MALSLSTAPTVEPVTLAEAKAHLKIDHTADDDYLKDFVIPAARRFAETLTRRSFLQQTWILRLGGFIDDPIVLPRPPLSSVSSITYLDSNGDSQTWATTEYTVEKPTGEYALHGRIWLAYSKSYPTTRDVVDSVTVTFVAGYGTAASAVPVGIKHGVLMVSEDLYRQRGSQVIGTIQAPALLAAERLLAPFLAPDYSLRFD